MPLANAASTVKPTMRDDGRAARDGTAQLAPRAAADRVGRPEARDVGPEQPASEQHERGGQHQQGEDHRHDDAHRAGEPERAVAGEFGEQQRRQREGDGRPARDDRRAGTAQGLAHRLPAILVQPQLVAIPRDQQQRVVRAGTEDEHGEDAGDRRVELDADGGRHLARDDARERVGGADHGQGHQPQPRAAVGDEQQDGDDDHGREQQREVGAGEHRGDIDLEALGTGEVDVHALEVGVRSIPQFLGPLGLRRDIRLGFERHHDQGHRAVVGDLGGRHEAVGRELREHARHLLVDLGEGVVAQRAVVAREHQQRRGVFRARELFEERVDLHRLRTVRQPCRGRRLRRRRPRSTRTARPPRSTVTSSTTHEVLAEVMKRSRPDMVILRIAGMSSFGYYMLF